MGSQAVRPVPYPGPTCEDARMTSRALCFVLSLACMLAVPASAHDTWLAPARFRMTNPGPVTLSLSSGMAFPQLDHSIAPDRVASATWQTERGRGEIAARSAAANALELRADAPAGITVYTVVLHPRASTLKRAQVREYIDHLGIPNADDVFAAWKTVEREETGYRYIKYAKTFVRAGAADASRLWLQPAGMRLELVPQEDPTSVRAGRTLDVLLLDGGKPLGRYPVALVREGAKEVSTAVTDAEGRVRLTLPAAGRYMLRATTLEPSAASGAAWDVHFTTLTFDAEAQR